MKQILQNIKNGGTEIVEVPVPVVRPGYLLIASAYSLVSAGTERMLLDFIINYPTRMENNMLLNKCGTSS